VDLCRVALWLESHTAGEPLTFLDHGIRCGDSLVGAFDLASLRRTSQTSRATSGLQPSSKHWLPILLSSPPPGSPTTSAAGPLTQGFMAALGRSPFRQPFGHWPLELSEVFARGGLDVMLSNRRQGGIGVMQPSPLGHDLVNKHRSWIQTADSA